MVVFEIPLMKKFYSILLALFLLVGCSRSDDASDPADRDRSGQDDSAEEGNSGDNDNDTNAAGYSDDNLEDIARDFKVFMDAFNIPGAQLAISRNEKLVYSAALGQAKTESNIAVNENSMFRISSISKSLTLLAVSQLVAEGKLDLDALVFGTGGLLGTTYGSPPYETTEMTITVAHLIEHKGGFTDVPYDIMFDDIRFTRDELIGKVLDERSLTYKPGTSYSFSNFGYNLLGRVIEKVTGKTYEAYVREEILYPMDLTHMRIGGNEKEKAFQNEVNYYSNYISPYQLNISRMDADGGWIASAKDLVKFAVHVDKRAGVPDLLADDQILGYFQSGRWNQNGAVPGTIAVLEVGYPFSFAVLLNKSETNYQDIIGYVRRFMNDKIREQENWPKQDMFDYY